MIRESETDCQELLQHQNHPAALTLRPYQREAIEAIGAAEARGVRRQVVALPTGTGKTVIFAHLVADRDGRSLILAHRDELIEQAAGKIRAVNPRAQVGICKADRDEWQAPIVVASIQTISRQHRLSRIPPRSFQTIIVDECHHAAAESYQNTLGYFGAFDDGGPLVVGFSATPERADEKQLADVFEEIVFRRDIESMIADRYLCDLRAVQVRIDANFDAVHTVAGDFNVGELAAQLEDANAPEQALEAWREHAAERKTLVFTPTVELATNIAERFSDAGISAAWLSGETHIDERRDTLRRLAAGRIQVLANCAVLTEGFDEPSIDCVVMARPTKSRPLYIQMIGRGTRPFPTKSDCLILDLVGATTRHEIVTAASLFNVNAQTMSERGLTDAIEERNGEARDQQNKVGPSSGLQVVKEVALFGKRKTQWVEGPGGKWGMMIAGTAIIIEPYGDAYRVISKNQFTGAKLLAVNLPLGYAQGYAEDHARELLREVFANPAAKWRSNPASANQIKTLARFRLPARDGITSGEASDMIQRAIDRRRSA